MFYWEGEQYYMYTALSNCYLFTIVGRSLSMFMPIHVVYGMECCGCIHMGKIFGPIYFRRQL